MSAISFFIGKMLSLKMLSPKSAFSKRAFCQGNKFSLYFISVLFYVTGSEFLVVTSTDVFYFRNHVSEMFPSKECHTCKKCQQGFKSPDESCVEPALHPAQRLNHAPKRKGTALRCGGATCVTPFSRLSTVFSEKHSRQDQVSHQVCGF